MTRTEISQRLWDACRGCPADFSLSMLADILADLAGLSPEPTVGDTWAEKAVQAVEGGEYISFAIDLGDMRKLLDLGKPPFEVNRLRLLIDIRTLFADVYNAGYAAEIGHRKEAETAKAPRKYCGGSAGCPDRVVGSAHCPQCPEPPIGA